jgi:nucleotide-binding universal stress UspA family protein
MNVDGHIVVGVDGSTHAARALDWAAKQAWLEHRTLAVVAVGDGAAQIAGAAANRARERHPWLEVHTPPRSGDPRQVLLDASDVAHLVVVGSRGRGAVRSLVLGSVSSAVAAHAACPVVVCRPRVVGASRGVVVGADGTPDSRPAIEFAYHQAALLHRPLTVLHGYWDAAVAVAEYRAARGLSTTHPDLEDLRAMLATSVAGLSEKYPDVEVELVLRHGFVAEALAPRDGTWDLVVVGRHPASTSTRLLTSSVSTAVLERARSTVAVVPDC